MTTPWQRVSSPHWSASSSTVARGKKTEARLAIFTWIESWYNPHRRHNSIGLRSPNNFERSLPAEPIITDIIEYNDLIQEGQTVR
jgi:hypothetical protein